MSVSGKVPAPHLGASLPSQNVGAGSNQAYGRRFPANGYLARAPSLPGLLSAIVRSNLALMLTARDTIEPVKAPFFYSWSCFRLPLVGRASGPAKTLQ